MSEFWRGIFTAYAVALGVLLVAYGVMWMWAIWQEWREEPVEEPFWTCRPLLFDQAQWTVQNPEEFLEVKPCPRCGAKTGDSHIGACLEREYHRLVVERTRLIVEGVPDEELEEPERPGWFDLGDPK